MNLKVVLDSFMQGFIQYVGQQQNQQHNQQQQQNQQQQYNVADKRTKQSNADAETPFEWAGTGHTGHLASEGEPDPRINSVRGRLLSTSSWGSLRS